MNRLTEGKCRDYLNKLAVARADALSWPSDYSCKCSEDAKDVQATLLHRMRAGDDGALDELLAYYPCLNNWAREVFEEAEWRCVVQAMVRNAMMEQVTGNFAVQLRLALIEAGTEIYTRRMAQISDNEEVRRKALPSKRARLSNWAKSMVKMALPLQM